MSSTHSMGERLAKDVPNMPRQGVADYEVAVIGAGPYGLSAAAHLKASGIGVRVFGKPMEFWAEKMPEGMLLRSPRVASNISDPTHAFSLESFELAAGKAPSAPIPLGTFVDYGMWFSKHVSADLDQRNVVSIGLDRQVFALTLESGEIVRVLQVVVAAGIGPFKRIPDVFKRLDPALASHCYEGKSIRGFAGKRVAVIGAGQSALESAALLHEAGADVEIIAKSPHLRWLGGHQWLHELGPISSLLYSYHDIGPVGISRLVSMPNVVRHLPLDLRDKIRIRAVRPIGSKWLRDRLAKVKVTTGRMVVEARAVGDEARMKLDDGSEHSAHHVLMGTGYSVDIGKYEFMSPELLKAVQMFDGYPVLTSGFCSSVPGLHFIGATAARSFGPLLYFVTGTEFASRELTSYIHRHRNC